MCTLGKRLEHILKYFNTTKKDFALSIEYSPGNVTDWIKGRYKPSSRALINIEKKYGISQRWLIEGMGNMFVRPPGNIIIDINKSKISLAGNFKNCNIKLTGGEADLIKMYRKLDEKNRRKVVVFIEKLIKSSNLEENPT